MVESGAEVGSSRFKKSGAFVPIWKVLSRGTDVLLCSPVIGMGLKSLISDFKLLVLYDATLKTGTVGGLGKAAERIRLW